MDVTIRSEADLMRLLEHLQTLNLDREWIVSVKRKTKRRSLSANGLYWQWMQQAGDEIGYDKNDMHETMKVAADCPITEIEIDGQTYPIRSTSRLSDADFASYMDRVYRKLAGDMGIYLTLPEERQCRK